MTRLLLLFCLFFSPLAAEEITPPPETESIDDLGGYISQEPQTAKEFDFKAEMLKMLFTLGALVIVLLALGWSVRRLANNRLNQANATSDIKVLERRAISPKAAVYLMEVRGHTFVVAESPHGVHKVTDIEQEV